MWHAGFNVESVQRHPVLFFQPPEPRQAGASSIEMILSIYGEVDKEVSSLVTVILFEDLPSFSTIRIISSCTSFPAVARASVGVATEKSVRALLVVIVHKGSLGILTSGILKYLPSSRVRKFIAIQLENFGIAPCQKLNKFFVNLETGRYCDLIVDIFDMTVKILVQLGYFQVVITEEVAIHFNPIAPVKSSYPHCDIICPMAKWSVQFWIGRLQVKVLCWRGSGSSKRDLLWDCTD